MGELKVKWHRRLPAEARIKTVTAKREAGRWFVCFNLEMPEPERLPVSEEAVVSMSG
ncbi:MAG TPA: hypothetical protein VKV73_09250 [Chloroflexota bacterium]|nr:hypothetical protein [Chloroflexota bacterium]